MTEVKVLRKVLEQVSDMLQDVWNSNPRSASVYKSALAAPILYLEKMKELLAEAKAEGDEDDSRN